MLYYQTDTHWKQENLDKVLDKTLEVLQIPKEDINYTKHTYDNFYGVYANEIGIKNKKDKIIYLTNEDIDNVKVSYLENPSLSKVYNEDN